MHTLFFFLLFFYDKSLICLFASKLIAEMSLSENSIQILISTKYSN